MQGTRPSREEPVTAQNRRRLSEPGRYKSRWYREGNSPLETGGFFVFQNMLSSRVLSLSPSPTLGLDARVKQLQDSGVAVINLGLGEPDFPTPVHIQKAAIRAIRDGFTRYTFTAGILELRQAISRKLQQENDILYDPSEIVVGVGSKQLLYHAFQALCNPGEEVILSSPAWGTYLEQIKLAQATPVVIPLAPPFKLTAAGIQTHISPKTKAILLNSPANPTGAVIAESELKKIASLAVKKNIYLISDEIYEKLIFTGRHISVASLGRAVRDLTLTINGVSKAHAMTGWRVGYAAGPQPLINAISALQSQTTSNTSSISQKAALSALTGSSEPFRLMLKELRLRRDFLVGRLSRIKPLSFTSPEGAFYIFVSVHPLLGKKHPTSASWCEGLLAARQVAVVPGEAFLAPGYFRLSFTSPLPNLAEAVRRIADFVSP